jgi:hypothetical protein
MGKLVQSYYLILIFQLFRLRQFELKDVGGDEILWLSISFVLQVHRLAVFTCSPSNRLDSVSRLRRAGRKCSFANRTTRYHLASPIQS